jgi:hypothetical protein
MRTILALLLFRIHLNPTHRFCIRNFKSIRLDRKEHKKGVLILDKNSLPSRGLKVVTNNQTEIGRTDITVDSEHTLKVFYFYCTPNRDLALDAMETTTSNCLVVRDFNSHSDRRATQKPMLEAQS